LVVAAKVFGFFLVKRTNTIITLRERLPDCTRETEYEILNILEFNSTRKRMSVIIRTPENKIILYCKVCATAEHAARVLQWSLQAMCSDRLDQQDSQP
jgi:magnesium-transporting ATPase (P-type)